MQNLVFTQLSIPEVRQLLRDELEAYFADRIQTAVQAEVNDIGGIELAEIITGLKRPTIYGLVSERKIPHSKKGKRLYFSRQELFDWLRQGKRKSQAEIAAEAASFISNKRKGDA
ncbi:MAG: helix-turn-helix domain-containing protein [Acidobacteria bacterium]|nr:helix-turn-helix domain-containing protein [Acidobacteriota bacterium]